MSLALGPQGYASPPNPEPVIPAAVQVIIVPPEPQPALQVTANEAQDPSPGTQEEDEGKKFDPHGPRRGRLLDIKG